MLTHARFLRWVLLVCSFLTLTGVHEPRDRLPVIWRISRLLALSGTALMSLSTLAAARLSADGAQEVLFYLLLSSPFLLSLVLLIWCSGRRRALHRLLRLQAAMGRDQIPRWLDNLVLLCQSALMAVLIISVAAVSLTTTFALRDQFQHQLYPVPMYIPVALRTSDWYPALVAFQVVIAVIAVFCLVLLTLILSGLLDATALELQHILRALQDCFLDAKGDRPTPGAGVKIRKVKKAWAGVVPVPGDGRGGGYGVSPAGDDEDKSATPTIRPDADLQLRQLSVRYRRVYQLTSDIAETFSVALLSLYMTCTAILLIGGYLMVVILEGRLPLPVTLSPATGLPAGLCGILYLVCLCAVSASGSRLTQQSAELSDIIAKDLWPRPMPSDAREQLQLLMNQTSTPLAIDVCGLFNLQKNSALSVISFALTYFVIMLQMVL